MPVIRLVRTPSDFKTPASLVVVDEQGNPDSHPGWDSLVDWQSRRDRESIDGPEKTLDRLDLDDPSQAKRQSQFMNQYFFEEPDADMHRRVGEVAEQHAYLKDPSDFMQVITEFGTKYTDFFFGDFDQFGSPTYSLSDWRNEWLNIGTWAKRVQDQKQQEILMRAFAEPTGWNLLIEKFRQHTDGFMVPQGGPSGNKDPNESAIRVTSWVGWCWALIVRDLFQEVTYRQCDNQSSDSNPNGCNHEVPDLLPSGNKSTNYCSTSCRSANL